MCSIEKSSAVTSNLLNDVQILNRCYTAEMLWTDLAIVVNSNCLLQTCFSELGLCVSQWKKIVPTVISSNLLFSLSKLTPCSISYAHCPSCLLPYIYLSHIVFCLLFQPPNRLSFSIASLIYLFIPFLLHWVQLFIRSIVFPLLKYCFDLFFYTPSQ